MGARPRSVRHCYPSTASCQPQARSVTTASSARSLLFTDEPAHASLLTAPPGASEADLLVSVGSGMWAAAAVDALLSHAQGSPVRADGPAVAVDEDAPRTIGQIPPKANP